MAALFLFATTFANNSLANEISFQLEGSNFKEWLKIGHYKKSVSGYYKSEILNENFFVSPQGINNPNTEFEAFLSLSKSYTNKSDAKAKEVLCKYPSRLTFIEKILPNFKRPKCEEYLKENLPQNIKSISLVFASGYFDSPSSYFGHALLKFNYNKSITNQKTLDSSLNYGANVTDAEGGFLYIIKGLLGGYNASYQRNNNFIHSHQYTNSQIRDVWEYELELTQSQTRFIIEHAWELKNAKFQYFYLNDNCAHRVINLVELATGKNLSESHGFWLLPLQIFQNLNGEGQNKNEAKVENLIKKESYYPSLKSKFVNKYEKLNAEGRAKFIRFFDTNENQQKSLINDYNLELMHLILNQLDLQVAKLTLKNRDSKALNLLNKQRATILSEIMSRQTKPQPASHISIAKSPLNNKPPSVIRAGYVNRAGESALAIKYQISNNDLLNNPFQGQGESRFIMGAIDADILEGGDINLRELDIIDIANINSNPLPMRLTKEFSWAVKVGYSSRNNICTQCSNVAIEGKVGKSAKLANDVLLYSLIGARLNNKQVGEFDYIDLVSESGLLTKLTNKTKLKLGLYIYANPFQGNPEYTLKSDLAVDISNNHDLRLGLENNLHNTSVMARLGFYFN